MSLEGATKWSERYWSLHDWSAKAKHKAKQDRKSQVSIKQSAIKQAQNKHRSLSTQVEHDAIVYNF